jgi:hypothetical protein
MKISDVFQERGKKIELVLKSYTHTHAHTHTQHEREVMKVFHRQKNLIICQDLSLLKETKVFNGFLRVKEPWAKFPDKDMISELVSQKQQFKNIDINQTFIYNDNNVREIESLCKGSFINDIAS